MELNKVSIPVSKSRYISSVCLIRSRLVKTKIVNASLNDRKLAEVKTWQLANAQNKHGPT